jgi:hypothetical protein
LEKVERFNQQQVDEINAVFTKHAALIQYFGYNVFVSREDLLASYTR